MSEIARPLNVVLRLGSPAHEAYMARAAGKAGGAKPRIAAGEHRAPGFSSDKKDDLKYYGGKTITDLVFTNRYLGGASAWQASDMNAIDDALGRAMSDSGLEEIIQQYFKTPISSTMLPSAVVPGAVNAKFYKDDVEAAARQLVADGALGDADPANSVICMMLPKGVVLVDDFSPSHKSSAVHDERERIEHENAARHVVRIGDDDEAADSKHGLGGYHGSIHPKGGPGTVYYAIAVYSEGDNGIPFFPESWKNVVATHYHELNEARTDCDIEDIIRGGPDSLAGWYSPQQGEIGDIPINVASSLDLVMKEIKLTDGSENVPVQLMWSNKVNGPAEP